MSDGIRIHVNRYGGSVEASGATGRPSVAPPWVRYSDGGGEPNADASRTQAARSTRRSDIRTGWNLYLVRRTRRRTASVTFCEGGTPLTFRGAAASETHFGKPWAAAEGGLVGS